LRFAPAPNLALSIRLYKAPHNRKRPSGEEGRFWGYYREERAAGAQM